MFAEGLIASFYLCLSRTVNRSVHQCFHVIPKRVRVSLLALEDFVYLRIQSFLQGRNLLIRSAFDFI